MTRARRHFIGKLYDSRAGNAVDPLAIELAVTYDSLEEFKTPLFLFAVASTGESNMERVAGIGSLIMLAAMSSFDARASNPAKPEPVTLVVDSHMDAYQAGGNADGSDGIPPVAYSFPATPGQVLVFSSVTGSWTCRLDIAPYGPDGKMGGCLGYGGAPFPPTGALSGFNLTDFNGPLVGVFLEDTLPSSPPPGLRFYGSDNSQGGIKINFQVLSPAIGQLFFIGDGRRGFNAPSSKPQFFNVPPTATHLYLGWLDVYFSDNAGKVHAHFTIYGGNGIDLSIGTATMTSSRWLDLRGVGVRYAAVEGWNGKRASCNGGAQLTNAAAAGVKGGAYCELNYTADGASQIDRCMLGPVSPSATTCATAPPYVPFATQVSPTSPIAWNFKPDFIAIEVTKRTCFGTCPPPSTAIATLQDALNQVTTKYQLPAVIYSDQASWSMLTGDSSQFTNYPLWQAASGSTFGSPPQCGDGTPTLANFVGSYFNTLGWQALSGKQYNSGPSPACAGTTLLSVPSGFDYFDPSLFP
jgi:hypothetical protein